MVELKQEAPILHGRGCFTLSHTLLAINLLIFLVILVVLASRIHHGSKLPDETPLVPTKTERVEKRYARFLLALNQRNRQIRSIEANHVVARILHKAIKVRLDGSLSYEKNLNFHLELRSVLGKEFDMGSNRTEFWFWSKRLKPCALYYAKQEDLPRAGLRPIFNPVCIKEALGFDEISVANILDVTHQGKNLVFTEKLKNQNIYRFTFLDETTGLLVGYMLSDTDGKCLASTEIVSYVDGLPRQILFTWAEENQSLLLDLGECQINGSIDKQVWRRPNLKPAVDLAQQSVVMHITD